MRIYISGPITDVPNHRDNFWLAGEWLKEEGHNVVNPVDHEPGCLGECTRDREGYDGKPHTWECYLKYDLIMMLQCEAVYVLSGWEKSRGAQLEVQVASACGLEIIYEVPEKDPPRIPGYEPVRSIFEEGK